ncbi:hypothetical protein [Pyxidicoccus xibeiensis]|uniref:hypothetical protein n=1 Tax=Pyxidicoccus xibeiensis TaxID=2906759 RepID=UPI0020A7BF3A|nr:hypothetical protein [Pyxidicoccus xibeiensis]MCP3138051.1 hypothetical protein [Pyxidicoccus xibeiensis]
MTNQGRETSADIPDRGFDSVLDYLLVIRRDFARLEMFIGEPRVQSMEGFILGYRLCLSTRGNMDDRYLRFREWLREVKGEIISSEGWATKFLRDCGNDHVRAIRKLLDLAAEFHAMEQRGTC